jgi:uncharacterized protein (TIRG00374 family)
MRGGSLSRPGTAVRRQGARPGVGRRLHLSQIIPLGLGLGAIVALILASNPAELGGDLSRFFLPLIPAILALSASFYVLQGLRWYFLLREVCARISLGDTILLNVAGQSTGLLPLGELTRAIFVAEAAGDVEFGDVVATVTVQELIFMLILVIVAVPGVLSVHRALPGLIVALLGIFGVIAMLMVSRVFHFVHRAVERTPVLRRFTAQVDKLREDTVHLLHRPATLGWSVISLAQAGIGISLFWLVVHGLGGGSLSWPMASFVLAASYVAGAVSLIPGGFGAAEASVVGLLLATGIPAPTATAAALLQRLADKGFATLIGFIAYAIAKRRFRLSGLSALRPDPRSQVSQPRVGAPVQA